MAKNIVYLELANNYLFLSWLKKVKGRFSLTKSKTIIFKNLELQNEILFNPSQLYLHIKDFLKTGKKRKAKAIINIPKLSQKNNIEQKFSTLQSALCFTKAGLKIEKIISDPSLTQEKGEMVTKNFFSKKELSNKLDFFKPFTTAPNTHPKKWLFSSVLLLLCLLILFFKINIGG